MRGAFGYMPILPARYGAFRSIATLSPIGVSQLTPMFDIRNVVLKGGKTIDEYLVERAQGINQSWNPERPVYIDVHDLPLDWRTSSGMQPISFVVDALRARGSRAIPVTGTDENRDKTYIQSIRTIAGVTKDGACLRLTRDELSEPQLLRDAVHKTVDLLALDPSEIDVVLDFRYVGKDRTEELRGTTLNALQVLLAIGSFRNLIFAGGSVPEMLTKRDNGIVRRQERIELTAWTGIHQVFSESIPLSFSDYGILSPHYVPPGKIVRPPARIRYTTAHEHVFRRAKRNEHAAICEELINSNDYMGATFSVGDQRLEQSAKHLTGPGNPGVWVGFDTSHHLEFVSHQIWQLLEVFSKRNLFTIPAPNKRPWLQPELLPL